MRYIPCMFVLPVAQWAHIITICLYFPLYFVCIFLKGSGNFISYSNEISHFIIWKSCFLHFKQCHVLSTDSQTHQWITYSALYCFRFGLINCMSQPRLPLDNLGNISNLSTADRPKLYWQLNYIDLVLFNDDWPNRSHPKWYTAHCVHLSWTNTNCWILLQTTSWNSWVCSGKTNFQ